MLYRSESKNGADDEGDENGRGDHVARNGHHRDENGDEDDRTERDCDDITEEDDAYSNLNTGTSYTSVRTLSTTGGSYLESHF